jgi:precorrin isomerase
VKKFVVIVGNAPTTERTLLDYIEHIVYGKPSRIIATPLGERRFAAVVEWVDQDTAAQYTAERMGSFPYAAFVHETEEAAKQGLGDAVWSFAPAKTPRPDWMPQS